MTKTATIKVDADQLAMIRAALPAARRDLVAALAAGGTTAERDQNAASIREIDALDAMCAAKLREAPKQ